MQPDDKPFTGYNDGYECWRDNAVSYGIDEALVISRNYLNLNLMREHSDEERQFCRELYSSTYFAMAGRVKPNKLIYPYDFKTACERTESNYYRASCKLNVECARGIDQLINGSCYKANFYNLEIAAMCAILDYGFARACSVLAFNYQNKGSDGRLSAKNLEWANAFIVQEDSFYETWLQAHAVLVDGFCNYVRELCQDLPPKCLALPGSEESGEFVGGVEVKQAVITSDDGNDFLTGYAIGHNPDAVEPWVCWQFAVRDGGRHYNWGVYANDEQTAIDAYIARIFVALN